MQLMFANALKQNGFSLVSAVMLLLLFGLLIFTSLNEQLSKYQHLASEEHHYLKMHNQALSALNWGLSQSWPTPDEQWFCQQQAVLALSVCLKKTSTKGIAVLKSDNASLLGRDPLILYYLVSFDKGQSGAETGDLFRLQKHDSGWLDYCPVKQDGCE